MERRRGVDFKKATETYRQQQSKTVKISNLVISAIDGTVSELVAVLQLKPKIVTFAMKDGVSESESERKLKGSVSDFPGVFSAASLESDRHALPAETADMWLS